MVGGKGKTPREWSGVTESRWLPRARRVCGAPCRHLGKPSEPSRRKARPPAPKRAIPHSDPLPAHWAIEFNAAHTCVMVWMGISKSQDGDLIFAADRGNNVHNNRKILPPVTTQHLSIFAG